ncbi:hypothetical protein ACFQDF_04085 [Ectobacillus funiculus]
MMPLRRKAFSSQRFGKSIYRFLIRLPESVATLTYVALKHTLQEQEAAKEETK